MCQSISGSLFCSIEISLPISHYILKHIVKALVSRVIPAIEFILVKIVLINLRSVPFHINFKISLPIST